MYEVFDLGGLSVWQCTVAAIKTVTQLLSVDSSSYELPTLGDAKGAEGVEVLSHIRKRREECVGASNIATGESNYILGLLYQYLGQLHKAAEHMRLALAIYENQLGAEHQSTRDVTLSLMQLDLQTRRGQGAGRSPATDSTAHNDRLQRSLVA